MYDLIIIGAGPAGLTAGLYAARKNLKTAIISSNIGGQVTWTGKIENYPGKPDIQSGAKFMLERKAQVQEFGVEFKTDLVTEITRQQPEQLGEQGQDYFIIHGESQQYESKAVIIAAGLEHRTLNVPGEKEFTGRGVTYCAICDGPMFKDKDVAVVGSGNSGLEAAEFLLNVCPKVYLLEMKDNYQGDKVLVDKISQNDKLIFMPRTNIKEIQGKDFVTNIKVNTAQQEKEITIQGLFVEIGYKTKTDWLKKLLDLNQKGEIKVNRNCATNVPGIFAAGDVTDVKYKQIIIAGGMGALAALAANEYLLAK